MGGNFTSIGGQVRLNIAALDTTTGAATSFDPEAYGSVNALAVSGSTVYAGGDFATIAGQARNSVAALDATSGTATAWAPNASGAVYALAVSGSVVYVGGGFTSIGGQTRHCVAAVDTTSGLATTWNPVAGCGTFGDPSVFALAVSGATVYAGGGFTSIGGQIRTYVAALDATSGLATAWDPNADNTVHALAATGSTLYAGGEFTSTAGRPCAYLARFSAPPIEVTVSSPNGGEKWNEGSIHDITWDPGAGGDVTIELSRDDGTTWETLFVSTANDGSEPWTVSGPGTVRALIRISNDFGNDTSDARFVIPPQVTSLTPVAATIGSQVTITGSGFGAVQGRITFAGKIAAVTSWSDTQAVCTVPAALTGVVPVVLSTADAQATAPIDFSIAPEIGSLEPTRAGVGVTVTIIGTAFGATPGSVTFAGRPAAVISWSDTQVFCKVPAGVAGVVPVVVTATDTLASAPTNFSVRPHIGSLLPAQGKVGITLTITGSGFGAKRGTAKVYFGSKVVTTYISWSNTKIKVRVPKLTKGKKSVTVTTTGGRSNAKTFRVI